MLQQFLAPIYCCRKEAVSKLFSKHCFVFISKEEVDFYGCVEYGTRLLVNSFSIPVVETLLDALQTKFPKKIYENYTYQYEWEKPQKLVKIEDE
jgi:hypothetical protein